MLELRENDRIRVDVSLEAATIEELPAKMKYGYCWMKAASVWRAYLIVAIGELDKPFSSSALYGFCINPAVAENAW